MKYKKLLASITVLVALLVAHHSAKAGGLAEGMSLKQVRFGLVCATPEIIHDALLKDHDEVPVIGANFDNGNTWLWYRNKENTTATFVVIKGGNTACMIFSGESEDGQALVPNAKPNFPVKESAGEEKWNS